MSQTSHGQLFIVAAPSGGGKTSLVKQLVAEMDDIEISVSHTTRAKRPGEAHGADYFFVEESAFLQMVERQEFVEYAQVFGHYYGTSIPQIKARMEAGTDIVLDIDWQGAQQIKAKFKDAISIFLVPPSIEELKKRLQARNQDNDEVIISRMNRARDEMSHYDEFDYLIINDSFEHAAADLKAIVTANRLLLNRQMVKQRKLLSFLLSSG